MSVITRANIHKGKAVPSFRVATNEEPLHHNVDPSIPAQKQLNASEQKAQQLEQLKQELLALDKNERDNLLQQVFADDLTHIVNAEQQKGFAAGEQQAQEQWLQKQQNLRRQFEAEQQALIEDLNNLVSTFATAKPLVELKDEAILVELVFAAVLKILDVQLAEGDYVGETIRALAIEFSTQETLELCLSKRDLHILDELNLTSVLSANMNLIEADNLLPGSYRIHIDGGAIESKLEDKLQQFKSMLLETYSHHENHSSETLV